MNGETFLGTYIILRFIGDWHKTKQKDEKQ